MILAFGKLLLTSPLPLREFEKYFKIKARKGHAAWNSEYMSVQKLLNHLSRYTQSECSREKYLQILYKFCLKTGYEPDALVYLSMERVERLIQNFVDELAIKDRSRSYLNSIIKRIKTFFRINGYSDLKVNTYFVPSRYRKRPEYIPTKREVYAMAGASGSLRNRAIILTLWSSGLRVSTLCALNYGDIAEEIKQEEPYVMIRVYPDMKERVPDSCKGRIPYFTFICSEASEALRGYLRERKENYVLIDKGDPLFYSDWTLWDRDERSSKRLGRRGIGCVVKKSARLAGILKWQHVTPNCLRKAFESILRSPTIDGGRMDKGTQEFFMGHILPRTQDPYYDKTKVAYHRKEYAKLNFLQSEVLTGRIQDKVINFIELEKYLNQGFMFIAKISENKVIVRLRS